jgi:hypothetical protein
MSRCDGYYKVENRRCDREGERHVRAVDGELYFVCGYHRRHAWTARVAHWNGDADVRRSTPIDLRGRPTTPPAFAWR